MRRVMVIGGAGAGKSMVARKLGEISGLPVIYLDQIFWQPGWELRPASDVSARVLDVVDSDDWIIDGNNFSTFEERAARADTIVFLDLATGIRLARVLRRVVSGYGRTRQDMAEGCPERFDFDFLKWVCGYDWRGNGRSRALQLIAGAGGGVRVHHLRTRAEVSAFLDATATGDGARGGD